MASARSSIVSVLIGLAGVGTLRGSPVPPAQPDIGVRTKTAVVVDGRRFRDANGSRTLDPYEDWRLPVEARVRDLVPRLTREEKAGLMLIDTLNAACEGSLAPSGAALVTSQKMVRFILRNLVTASGEPCRPEAPPSRSGAVVSPLQMAVFTNTVQALAESQRLGIPVLFKDNARNHHDTDPRFGISSGAGAFSEFPKEAGIAAAVLGTGDLRPVDALTDVMGREWRAVGLRGMYGYMADLATEPRWYRVQETFTEDADLAARLMRALVRGLQGGPLTPASSVALTIKHFPGGGPQELGLDPHYSFGKRQVYPAGRFEDHLKPFVAAIEAGASAVMPYYGAPVKLTYRGVTYAETGFAFSKTVVTDLLRGTLGFTGYVNSDTGIVTDRAWGLEARSVPERVAAAINGGTDVLSGFNSNKTITDLVDAGLVTESRLDEAAARLLAEQFRLGLFENPYVDERAAPGIVGAPANRAKGFEVQKQSIVLLQNTKPKPGAALLPLAAGTRVYTLGIGRGEIERVGLVAIDGNAGAGQPRPAPVGADAALIRIHVRNTGTSGYRTKDPATGANQSLLNPTTGKPWGAEDPCMLAPAVNPRCVDDGQLGPGPPRGLAFGGALPWEAGHLSFTTMAASQSWEISPSLADIQSTMKAVGGRRTILAIYFRQPYVLDAESGLPDAGAILATFGVSDAAIAEVVSGRAAPRGKLPFALARTLQAVTDNDPDAPGYGPADTLFPFGFGLRYESGGARPQRAPRPALEPSR